MTDNNHPITPPFELLQQWAVEYWGHPGQFIGEGEQSIANQAARWGADQELEACCEWLDQNTGRWDSTGRLDLLAELRADRRPKPPTLKERGRKALQSIHNAVVMETGGRELDVLKEIVESLPD